MMVIQSSFKDYYDFVAHRYGGGDPKVVYARGRIKNEFVEVQEYVLPDLSRLNGYYSTDKEPQEFKFLAVAGKVYLLSRKWDYGLKGWTAYRITDPEKTLELGKSRWYRQDWSYLEREDATLIELSRRVGAPVFVIRRIEGHRRNRIICIDELCPILKDLGMASLIPPEQMYQELAYFMGNTMHPSPDIKPPVEVSNRDKILAAGFDLRQSFRHRSE